MRLNKPSATITVMVALMLTTSFSEAAISFDLSPVDNSALLTGYTTYDMQVTTDTDWTAAAMLLELSTGIMYQHEYGTAGQPNPFFFSLFPELEFDTYVIGNRVGGGGDVGGDSFTFGAAELDTSWYNMADTDIGTITIGRVTMTNDAVGSMAIMLTNDGKETVELSITIDSGAAQASMPSGGSLAFKTIELVDIESSFQTFRDSIFDPNIKDTRVRTPINMFSYDPIPTKTISPGQDESLPDPATMVLLGTGLGIVVMRRMVK